MSILTEISNEINKLNENIENIKVAIQNKGVASQGKLKNFPQEIASIQSSSSSNLLEGYTQNSSLLYKENERVLRKGEFLLLNSVLEIPNSIEEIEQYCFAYSTINLVEVNAPNTIKIGNQSFNSCPNLRKINFPNLREVGSYVFYNSPELKQINLPNLLKAHSSSFGYCRKAIYISLRKCTDANGYQVFGYTEKLELIELPLCEKFNAHTFNLAGRSSSSSPNALKYLVVKNELPKSTIDVFKNGLHNSTKIINASLTREFNRSSGTWENLTSADTVRSEIEDIKRRAEV